MSKPLLPAKRLHRVASKQLSPMIKDNQALIEASGKKHSKWERMGMELRLLIPAARLCYEIMQSHRFAGRDL